MFFFEVSTKRRLLQCFAAIFWCLLGAGPIFGFAALKPTLISQGIYEDVCQIDTLTTAPSVVAKCSAQDLKLNFMFTVAAALTNVCALVIGRVLDTAGPRACGLIASSFLFLSCFTFIFASSLSPFFDPYLTGFSFMALGGPFAYISSFQLSNAFPEKSGLILAIITGSFDTSSAVFLVYKKLYFHNPSLFTLENFYKVYLFVPAFITIVQLTVMPSESYLIPPADIIPNPTPMQRRLSEAIEAEERFSISNFVHPDEQTALLQAPILEQPLISPSRSSSPAKRKSSLGDVYKSVYIEEEIEAASKDPDAAPANSIFGILHGFPSGYQFRTWWFSLICLYSTVQMLRLNYFVATVNSQYTYLFASHKLADKLNRVFDIALPLGGVVSIPVVGLFLDNFSTAVVLSTLLAISLIIGLLGIVTKSFVSGLLNVLLFVCFRPFFYTTISDYCAKVFGFETFGTIYGAIMTVAGVFNISQSYLDRLTHSTFSMNPIPVNVFLIALTVISGGGLVAYVCAETKMYNRRRRLPNQGISS